MFRDVKRGQNLEAETRAMRPRPKLQGRGQGYEVKANFLRSRPGLREKIELSK